MTPGLAGGPPFPQGARRGALVAIASTESPTVPVAVGICEIDVSSLDRVQGSKGHAVQILHWAGDELWAWSASGKPGGSSPEHLNGWICGQRADEEEHDDDDEGMIANGISGIKVDEGGDDAGEAVKDGGVPLNGSQKGKNRIRDQSEKSRVAQHVNEDEDEDEDVAEEKEREMTTKGKQPTILRTRA